MWGRPLDTAMMDPWFREQFSDAHAIVVSDQERGGSTSSPRATTTSTRTWRGARGTTTPSSAGRGSSTRSCRRATRAPASLLPDRDDARLDLQDVALATRGREGGARSEEPARVREDLADRPAERRLGQGDQVRDVLCPGAGVLPRQPHRPVRPRRQDAGDVGHGRGHEPGASAARRLGLQGRPGRGADAPFHCLLLPGGDEAARLPRRLLQPRDRGPRRGRGLDPHLLGQSQHAEGLQRRVVRELRRDLPRAPERRRVDGRGDRERPARAAALQALP